MNTLKLCSYDQKLILLAVWWNSCISYYYSNSDSSYSPDFDMIQIGDWNGHMKVQFWKGFHETLVARSFGGILTFLPCLPKFTWNLG